MSTVMNKRAKINEARKNAEAQKAKKKALRDSRLSALISTRPGVKGRSLVAQSKKR